MRAYVFSPKKQTATVAIEGENPWRVWVNDGVDREPAVGRESFEVGTEGGLERGSGEGGERRQAARRWACASPATSLRTAGTPGHELPVSRSRADRGQ